MMHYCRYLLAICFLMLCSCTHLEQLKVQELNEECEKSVKDYNKLLRWREIEKAGMLYMERTLRDDFLKKAEVIKGRGITITDFRILTTECRAENKSAEALVEFDYFILPSNRIKTLSYRQDWKFTDTMEMKGWQVKSVLPDFD